MRGVYVSSKTLALVCCIIGLVTAGSRSFGQDFPIFGLTDGPWEYNESTTTSTSLHGTGWELLNYDINSAPGWKTGNPLFGNDGAGVYNGVGSPFQGGLNGFITPLDRTGGRITFYFRKKFTWSQPTAGALLALDFAADDAIVVYLNGQEVYRAFMVDPPLTPTTWDSLGQNHDPEGTIFRGIDIPTTTLVQGVNQLAVELHQVNATSSDIAFAMGLNGTVPFAPTITTPTQPSDRVVLQSRTTTLAIAATGSRVVSYQWYFKPTGGATFDPVPGATGSNYTILAMAAADAGQYYCTVSNPVGSVDSRTATVGFTTDGVAPRVVRAVGSANFTTVQVEFDEPMDAGTPQVPGTAADPLNYSVEASGVPLGVSGASVNPNGTSVTLTLGGAMAEDTEHVVVINFVNDLAGNTIADNTRASFRSWVSQTCYGSLLEAYNGLPDPNNAGIMGGNAVRDLTSHSTFPNSPTETLRVSSAFDGGEVGYGPPGGEAHEGYGARMRGIFIPPSSGLWRFALRTDDGGQLWFNPNGPGSGGRTLIAEEPGCCGSLVLPVGDRRLSNPQNLTAGQPYYIETMWKEGTGGDYCQVAAVLDGLSGQATNPIPKEWLGSAMIAGSAGTFTITQPPANAQVPDGTRVAFSVGTSTEVPLCYQWLRDGSPIAGAIGPNYSLVPALADNGAKFSVSVSIPGGGTLTSSEATLTVARDTVPPVAIAVAAGVGGTTVTVSFNERIDATTAQNAANYSINGISPISATVQNNTNVVLVPAAPLASGVSHECVIRDVTDGSANKLTPNPTTLAFATPIVSVKNDDTQIWRFWDTGVDLGSAWRQKSFDDSGWQSGPGALALEDQATMPPGWTIRTMLPNFGTMNPKKTFYFRTHFNLPVHPAVISRLQLTEVVDDGSAAYINGTLVNANRLTPPFTFDTLSGGAPSEAPHPAEVFSVPTTSLVQGDNVLAVEVHQSSDTSSDVLYGAELIAFPSRYGIGLVITPVSGTQARLEWPDASYHVESAPNLTGPWTSQPGIVSGNLINTGPNNQFLRLTK